MELCFPSNVGGAVRQLEVNQQQLSSQEQLNLQSQSAPLLQSTVLSQQGSQQLSLQQRAGQVRPMIQKRLIPVHPIRQGIAEQRSQNQPPRCQSLQNPISTSSRLSSLFNWNPSSNNVGEKRKSRVNNRKKKLQTWTHTFVCLSNTNQEVMPDGQERAELQIAGLGEKRVTLLADADTSDISLELSFQFPKLSSAGGFELLRSPEGGGKVLDIIPSPESGYNASYLKAVVHHAKIYIRPLQQDLSLEPIQDTVNSVNMMTVSF